MDSTLPAPDNTQRIIVRLWQNFIKHWPVTEPSDLPLDDPPPTLSVPTRILVQAIPWVLGIMFVASFFWDFDGLYVSLSWLPWPNVPARTSLEGLMMIMSSSGIIGFFTNWVAITMIFRPRKPHPILGQGIIPAQRENLIERTATGIERELIGPEVIKKAVADSGVVREFLMQVQEALEGLMNDQSFRQRIRETMRLYLEGALNSEELRGQVTDLTFVGLERSIDNNVVGKAVKAMLKIPKGRGLVQSRLRNIVDQAFDEKPKGLDMVLDKFDGLLDTVPAKLSEHVDTIEEWSTIAAQNFVGNLDIRAMVIDRLEEFDDRKLEELVKYSSDDQLNYIKYLGGILGAIGGLIIFNRTIALPVLGGIVLVVVGLDQLLLIISRHRKNRRNTPAR